ncbi:MAG: AsmA family protein, partial [Pseudomonadales bacterium]
MSRFIIILGTVIVLPLITLVAILFFVLDNPDAYKQQASDLVRQETGNQLVIDGDISWRFFPPIAIEVTNISLVDTANKAVIVSLKKASVDLELMPLLFDNELNISGLSIDGIVVDAQIDKDGTTNWSKSAAQTELQNSPAPTTAAAKDTAGEQQKDVTEPSAANSMNINIASVSLTNGQVSYTDARTEESYEVTITRLQTTALVTNKATDLTGQFLVKDNQAGIAADIKIDGSIMINDQLDVVTLKTFSISGDVDSKEYGLVPLAIEVDAIINSTEGTANVQSLKLNTMDIELTSNMTVTYMDNAPQILGHIDINSFDARPIAAKLQIELPQMSNKDALSQVSLSADLDGSADLMSLTNLNLAFDESKLTGKLTANLNNIASYQFDLKIDQIDLTGYMAPDPSVEADSGLSNPTSASEKQNVANTTPTKPSTSKTASATIEDSEIIPVQMLVETPFDGTVNIEELRYEDYRFSDLKLDVENKSPRLTLSTTLKGYGGTIELTTNIKAIRLGKKPITDVQLSISNLDIASLAATESITGALDLTTQHRFKGDLMSEILSSIAGDSRYTVNKGTIDVTAFKQVATVTDAIIGKQSSISQWPDMLPFENLKGNHKFEKGAAANQTFRFSFTNMDVSGKGGFDYFGNAIDYRVSTTFREDVNGPFTVNPKFAGIELPVDCNGSLDLDTSELCKPDNKAVAKIM